MAKRKVKRKSGGGDEYGGPPELMRSQDEARSAIDEQIAEGQELLGFQVVDQASLDEYGQKEKIWSDYNRELLKSLFSTGEIADEYSAFGARSFSMNPGLQESTQYVRDDVQTSLTRLESVRRRIKLFPGPAGAPTATPATVTPGDDVFVVHGHDEAAKEAVARYLEKLGLSVTILHEKPNKGQTIIEKLESNAGVGFAVILLTPDDVGGVREGEPTLVPRARQNVVFEHGYFVAKLGRGSVCAIYAEGVELPSDIDGVLYIPYDAESAWKLKLAGEMKAAGLDIDLNKAV